MGAVLAEKIVRNIESSKGRGLARLLTALGIRHVGGEIAGVLAEHFGSLEALAAASAEAIAEVEGIGVKIAESVHAYFRDPAKSRIIEKLVAAGVSTHAVKAPMIEGPLNGETWVFTGTLSALPRSRAEALVKSLGGTAASSVTRKTTFVVAGADPGSKVQKAEGYGVPVLSEDEFRGRMRELGVELAVS
jgi:DNA ligase (NAD+)